MWRALFLLALLAAPQIAEAKVVRMFVGRYAFRDPGTLLLAPTVEYGGIRAETPGSLGTYGYGSQVSASLVGISAGERDIQGQASIGYRYMDLAALDVEEVPFMEYIESSVGIRYFPRAPTFLFAEWLTVRVTAAADGGGAIAFNGDPNFFADLSGGLHFSAGRVPHGLVVEIVHRPTPFTLTYRQGRQPGDPVAPEGEIRIRPWSGVRVSFFFGP